MDSIYASTLGSSYFLGHHKDLWKTFDPVTGKGTMPIWNANENSSSLTSSSDYFLVSSSYFSLKNVTAGYTFSGHRLQKARIQSLRLYASAENLWFTSKRKGLDPRISMSGVTSSYGGYAQARTISLGIECRF